MPNLTPDGKFSPETEQKISDWISDFIGKGLTDGIVPPEGTIAIALSDEVNMTITVTAKLTVMQQAHGNEPGYTVTDMDYHILPLPGLIDPTPTDDTTSQP